MKMTHLALAGRIGFFGANGLTNFSPAAARLKNPSADNSPVRATDPNPAPTSQRNSRRVRPQNCRPIIRNPRKRHPPWSVQINELVRVQRQQTILSQRLLVRQTRSLLQLMDEGQVL